MHLIAISLAAATAFLGLAGAQSSSASSGSSSSGGSSSATSQLMPPSATQAFDISKVDPKTKGSYCLSQQNNCRMICDGGAQINTCDQNTFQFQCSCINGTVPDLTAYTGTIPYFECIETYQQCVQAHPDDIDGQTNCKNNEKCGSMTAHNVATESTTSSSSAAASSTAAASTTGGGAAGGSATSASASSTSSGSSSSGALVLRPDFGTGVFTAVVLAALWYL